MPPEAKAHTEKLMKLVSEIGTLFNDSVKKEEFLVLFEKLTKRILTVHTELSRKIDETKKDGDSSVKSLRNELLAVEKSLSQMLSDLGVTSGKSLETVMNDLQSKIEEVRSLIPTLPDYTEDFGNLRTRLAEIRPDTSEEIRNKLELFVDEEEKLKIDAIGYLRKELDELKKIRTGDGGGNGLAFREMITKYDLSPYLDGVTKTFNIPGTYAILSVGCSSFPSVLRPTIDYTHTQSTITFTSEIEASTTLASGQTVIIMLINA